MRKKQPDKGEIQGLSVLTKYRAGEPKPSGAGQRDGEPGRPHRTQGNIKRDVS